MADSDALHEVLRDLKDDLAHQFAATREDIRDVRTDVGDLRESVGSLSGRVEAMSGTVAQLVAAKVVSPEANETARDAVALSRVLGWVVKSRVRTALAGLILAGSTGTFGAVVRGCIPGAAGSTAATGIVDSGKPTPTPIHRRATP